MTANALPIPIASLLRCRALSSTATRLSASSARLSTASAPTAGVEIAHGLQIHADSRSTTVIAAIGTTRLGLKHQRVSRFPHSG